MKQKLSKAIRLAKKLPQKKHHLDFIAALLTIPVLLSVIILNYSNLQSRKANPTPTPTSAMVTQTERIIVVPQTTSTQASNNPSNSPTPISNTCTKDIGPILISSPTENQTITDNPVCINIKYLDSSYCSVVWSYRINNGAWSDFSSNNPCIYNLNSGNIKFDLKVQSTVTQKEENLTRDFNYKNNLISPTPNASQSANLQ